MGYRVGLTYNVKAQYANGLGIDSKLAKYIPAGLPNAGPHHYLTVALGSVTHVLSEPVGGVVTVENKYRTDAWGVPLVDVVTVPNRYGFTGRERDAESSLMHYRARAYDPGTGSFLQNDPIVRNRATEGYRHARNNPLMYTDPTGEDWRLGEFQMPLNPSEDGSGSP